MHDGQTCHWNRFAGSSAANLASVVGKEHQGRGYVTEAAQAMVDWLIRQDMTCFSACGRTGLLDPDGEESWELN